MAPTKAIHDQFYQIGTEQLEVFYQQFEIIPVNPIFSIVYSLRVTSLTGSTIRKVYENYELPTWVTFDPFKKKISILS